MFKNLTNGKINEYKKLLLHVDGGCEPKNPGGVTTSGWAIFSYEKLNEPIVEHSAVVQDGGPLATNNYGEYVALCLAMKWLCENKWQGELVVKADSKLLIEQVSGRWKINALHLKPLRKKIWDYLSQLNLTIINESNPFPEDGCYPCHLIWVKRDMNQYANDLCRRAYQEYVDEKITITSLLDSGQNWA